MAAARAATATSPPLGHEMHEARVLGHKGNPLQGCKDFVSAEPSAVMQDSLAPPPRRPWSHPQEAFVLGPDTCQHPRLLLPFPASRSQPALPGPADSHCIPFPPGSL